MLMEQDRFDEAFEFFCRQDSISGGNGVEILLFMQECTRRKRFEQALTAAEYFMRHHPRSSLKNSVNFSRAEAYIGTGQYAKALETYESIADDFIRPAHRAEANLNIGLLYMHHLGNMDKAREYLGLVIASVPGGSYAVHAQQALADIAIGERRFDTAVSLFQSVLERDLPPEIAERVEFLLATTFLFREDYNEAVTRFRQIISRYPRGFYVNDAIQYSLLISETLDEAPKQIDLFSSAEYFRYTNQSDSLEYYLSKICRVGIPSLAPISYVHLAQLYAGQQRIKEAISAVDSLTRLHPESYFLPYGLKLKADIFMELPEERDRAMELYRELLSEYPSYPFAAEIRDIIRRESPPDRS
jgi:TolA-binding protein